MAYMFIFFCFFFIIPIVVGIWIILSVGKQEKELKQTLMNNPPQAVKG
jgi:predicted permease